MPHEITMPRLSDTMESGTVIKWNVKKGDSVEPGDVLADIETDKATMELQAFEEGTVARILLDEGESVPVGETILVLAGEGEDVEEAAGSAGGEAKAEQKKQEAGEGEKQKKDAAHADTQQEEADADEQQGEQKSRKAAQQKQRQEGEPAEASMRGAYGGVSQTAEQAPEGGAQPAGEGGPAQRNGRRGGRVFASPLARKVAEEHGVDLSELEGTGPGGRIVKADVEAAAEGGAEAQQRVPQPQATRRGESPAPAPVLPEGGGLEARTVELSNMRRTIAKRLVESKTTIPHYQVTLAVDMDRLNDLREQLNEQLASQNVKLTVNDFIVRACALAMHQHPFVNSRWNEDGDEASIEIQESVNVGVAIALPEERGGGLVVATLREADRMGLRQISSETKRLAKKAREKGLTIEEMSDSTFTVSNLGMFGVEHFTAIINPPNTAILAVGAAIEQPVVRDEGLVVGSRMQMTMSSDHRVVDGAMAAKYLSTVKQLLEHPATLLV